MKKTPSADRITFFTIDEVLRMNSIKKTWIPEMEGFRGLASAWVFIGHICILVQCRIPILGDPSYGVDLFILLSGLLMTKNYIERRSIEPWGSANTAYKFWVRRFFRIAPLYYALLAVAIYYGPSIGHMRDIISETYPGTATETSRFNDQSLKNIVIHLSLLFGLTPEYSFRTVLPDWSIGLEIQYYILFPAIMLIGQKFNLKLTLITTSFVSTLIYFIFPDFYKSFPMPSFILLKLPIFIAGMFVYLAVMKNSIPLVLLSVLVVLIASITNLHIDKKQLAIQITMCLFIFIILSPSNSNHIEIIKTKLKWLLNNKFCVWLGDVSYSVYLIHLLIVTPVIGILVSRYNLANFDSLVRLLIVAGLTIPIVYFIAYFTFKYIEKPGVKLGKAIISHIK